MKTMMNFTLSQDDTDRYRTAQELKAFYEAAGCDGLELMPLGEDQKGLIGPGMTVGVHACCLSDWMELDRSFLSGHYRKDLETARALGARYVVFHVTQVDEEEIFTYRMKHTDREVIEAAADLINGLLDGQDYEFEFLMENLWWPGLNFTDPSMTRLLLESVNYPQKGLMLDTGHYLHTNRALRSQGEALAWLHQMLDAHQDLIPLIRGVHLQQSLTGACAEEWARRPPVPDPDPDVRAGQLFSHIFSIDRHLPFTHPEVRRLIRRIDPAYVTYEYITRSKKEHARFLKAGRDALFADGSLSFGPEAPAASL
ncbi:MAG: TIM barrel protein [Eubacteriales bacterium]|nr:TIM barrel protein [Eubacteriales bacterium]